MKNKITREEKLLISLRTIPLKQRLKVSRKMIGDMCSAGRPPKMTIPVQYYDEDFYISNTLKEAPNKINELEEELKEWKP